MVARRRPRAHLLTSTATIATAVGFAFHADRRHAGVAGDTIRAHGRGLGGGGIRRQGLAPAVGLAPEVPGMAAADSAGRQEWWSDRRRDGGGDLAVSASDKAALRVLAIALSLAPHAWARRISGRGDKSSVPPELAARSRPPRSPCTRRCGSLTGSSSGSGGAHWR